MREFSPAGEFIFTERLLASKGARKILLKSSLLRCTFVRDSTTSFYRTGILSISTTLTSHKTTKIAAQTVEMSAKGVAFVSYRISSAFL
jgi:hypothetical protein